MSTEETNDGAVRLQSWLAAHPTVTAAELARRCDMFPQQLCHLMKGRRSPTLEQALALNRHARIPFEAWAKKKGPTG